MVDIDKIKQLRQETGISISECKKALEESDGDLEKAKETLKKWGRDFAQKKMGKLSGEGIIEGYVHPNKKIGVLLEINCETDFVAKNSDFQKLAHELCLQIAAMGDDGDILNQPWIKDETKTIGDLIKEYIAKLGENIIIKRFVRYEI